MKTNIILFFLGISLVVLSFCRTFNKSFKENGKIVKLVFYNTIRSSLDESKITFHTLNEFPFKEFVSNDYLDLINWTIYVKQSYIWMGNIYGKLIFENNDSCIIKISRYGAFYKIKDDNKFYTFKNDVDKKQWQEILDGFLSSE